MDSSLTGGCIHAGGPEDEVEIGGQRVLDRLNAAGAGNLKVAGKVALQADIGNNLLGPAVLMNDLRTAFRGHIANLRGLFAQIYGAGFERQVEVERLFFKVKNFDFHDLRVSRMGARVN